LSDPYDARPRPIREAAGKDRPSAALLGGAALGRCLRPGTGDRNCQPLDGHTP
jgi:hypothetical protein